MRKIGSNIVCAFGNDWKEGLGEIKRVGFDAFFTGYTTREEMLETAKEADKLGLVFDTIHSDFGRMNSLWQDGSAGDDYTAELCEEVKVAGEVGVPTVIMHTTIGNILPKMSKIGIDRFGKIIETAEKSNVVLAFENLEFIEPLGLIFHNFGTSDKVRYCFDLGHENCYTPGLKFLRMYGDRLAALHIHDNTGIADSMDVDYRDDRHLIPFDGSIDYKSFAKDLAKTGYEGTLMLEIGNREDYNFYKGYTLSAFYERAYAAAMKLRGMVDAESEKL